MNCDVDTRNSKYIKIIINNLNCENILETRVEVFGDSKQVDTYGEMWN